MKQINIANQSYLKQKKNNFISYFKYYYSELIQTCSLFFPPSRFQFIRFYVTFYRISGSLHASRSSINVSSEQIITWTAGNTRFYQLNGIFSFFSLFFFFFSSLDDRLATRANAKSVALASSILCGYVPCTFTLERRFVLPHSALLDGQRKNELRDRREAGSYRLSPAPRDSIRMVAALLPARQHHQGMGVRLQGGVLSRTAPYLEATRSKCTRFQGQDFFSFFQPLFGKFAYPRFDSIPIPRYFFAPTFAHDSFKRTKFY